MSRGYRKLVIQFFMLTSITFLCSDRVFALSSLARNDAFPIFTTIDPHTFLYDKERLQFKNDEHAQDKNEHVGISISPFGQNADRGKNIASEPRVLPGSNEEEFFAQTLTELGDLQGRTSMIALLMGSAPMGRSLDEFPILKSACDTLFPNKPAGFENGNAIDPMQQYGYFSFPIIYRKRGVRFEVSANLLYDFGISLQTGVVSLRQAVPEFRDLTDLSVDFEADATRTFPKLTKQNVDDALMDQFVCIAREIGVNVANFCENSVEEIRLNLYWRHIYEINENKPEWPHFLLYPFFVLSGSISPGKEQKPSKFFAAPFGNNGHSAIGFTTGLNFDFIETIEVGFEAGVTHFFGRNVEKLRVPNSKFQGNLFPFTTDAKVDPGNNWHFGAKISAYHFLDNLSMYFQYLLIEHKEDCITLKKPDPAFKPELLERISCFRTKIANIGLNYDISPNMTLGVLWQAPLSQRNTYRSSTLMATLYATF